MPAFEAIVPDLLPRRELPAANALDQFVRPIALRLVGPALGGVLVAASARASRSRSTLRRSSRPPSPSRSCGRPPHVRSEHVDSRSAAIKEGLRFVRSRVWLWGTLLSAAFAYLAFMGPAEVLLPYVVKNELHASARRPRPRLRRRRRRSRSARRSSWASAATRGAT